MKKAREWTMMMQGGYLKLSEELGI